MSLLEFLSANPIYPLFGGALIVIVGLMMIMKTFGLKWINITSSIILYLRDNLQRFGMENEKIKLIVDIMAQAITTAIVINGTENDEQQVEDAMMFVCNICKELNVTLDASEQAIMRITFGLVFSLIRTFKIPPTKIKYGKLVRANAHYHAKIVEGQ